MPRKKTMQQQLQASLRKAQAADEVTLQQELQVILLAVQQPWPQSFRRLTRLLREATSHVTKHYVAEIFGEAKDIRVVKPLLQAAKAPENAGYNARYIWACAQYDCTPHLNFFVQFIRQCQDPGEAMVASVAVIEAMRGPFKPDLVNRSIVRLLQRNRSALAAELREQDELFTVQAAYALLDTYFSQIDARWKSEHPFYPRAFQLFGGR